MRQIVLMSGRGLAAVTVLAAAVACSTADEGSGSGGSAATSAGLTASVPPSASSRAVPDGIVPGDTGLSEDAAVELVRGHLVASNDGDADAWAAALSDDVRFDIGGSVYDGVVEVRGWGERDPIGRGRYEIVSIEAVPGGVTADVVFRAGSLVENIRYQYNVRGGRIVNLFARYR